MKVLQLKDIRPGSIIYLPPYKSVQHLVGVSSLRISGYNHPVVVLSINKIGWRTTITFSVASLTPPSVLQTPFPWLSPLTANNSFLRSRPELLTTIEHGPW